MKVRHFDVFVPASPMQSQVDNSQAGVRDFYLLFRGHSKRALVNISSVVFLKSIVVNPTPAVISFADRVDVPDNEPQAANAWGIPDQGYTADFEDGQLSDWNSHGISITKNAIGQKYSVGSLGTNCNFAFTPGVYINQTDTGGEWRTLAEASLTADLVLDSAEARPGIGFASKDGRQWVYVVLNAAENSLEAWRKNSDGSATRIKQITGAAHTPTWSIQTGTKYRLEMDWSPYSDALIVFLHDQQGAVLADFRAVIDLPAARRPLLACSGGEARFDNVKIQPWMVGIQSGSGKKLRFLPRTSAIRVLRNWEPPCIFMELR